MFFNVYIYDVIKLNQSNMKIEKVTISLKIPTDIEFLENYPRYNTFLSTSEGIALYSKIASADYIIGAIEITKHLGLPAVTAAGLFVQEPMAGKDFEKQFIGSLTCAIMELNGYEKTGIKKSVPIEGFTKGEVYKIKVENTASEKEYKQG